VKLFSCITLIAIALSKAVLREIISSNWKMRLIKPFDNVAINRAQAILSLTFFEHSGYARHDSRSISEPNDAKFSENFCLRFVNTAYSKFWLNALPQNAFLT